LGLIKKATDGQPNRLTTGFVVRAGLAAVAYIAVFAVMDWQLETHTETAHRMLIRLIVVSIALVGALGAIMHVVLHARAAQEEADRRMQAAQEEARLQGALLTIRELAPWVAPNAARSFPAARTRLPDRGSPLAAADPFASKVLTAREREVAMLIAQGKTSREIAEALVITERTADTHADRIRVKLGLHSRAEIVAWVLSKGLQPVTRA
jgi:DNA-binding CsgD family transcriptional regulator